MKSKILTLFSTLLTILVFNTNTAFAQCATPGGCDAACPSICVTDATLAGISGGICLGGMTELLCLDWNGVGDPSTIVVDYTLTPSLGETIALVPNAAGTQVCIEVTTPPGTTCTVTETQLAINSITPAGGCTLGYDLQLSQPIAINETGCDINTGTISPFPIINLDLLPTLNGQLPPLAVYPTYDIIIVPPGCDGMTTGSATLEVAGTQCDQVLGVPGAENVCPDEADTDGTLTYDFSTFSVGTLADGTALTLADAIAAGCVNGAVSDAITIDCLLSCNCDPAIAAATAPAAVVTAESTCEADGVTLSGGVIDPPAGTCPTGSTLEYSTDGGVTWVTTLPIYDQMVPITVDTRCVCDLDATVASATASVTTVPGMCANCDAIAAATAPAAVVTTESTCEADGVTLSGGVIDVPAMACPMGSTLEYSTDGGATWSATLPIYDQTTAVTVDTRCLCDLDNTIASITASVTTVPGMCAVVECGITAGEPAMPTATVCNTELSSIDVTMIFGDPGPAGTPSLVQNYAVTDPATGDLITISNTATLDLSMVPVGGMACVQAIAYTQETLDAITAAIDNVTQFPGSPVPAFGMLDLSGFLNGLNGVFETVGFQFTAADIQGWCETQTLTIPFSSLPGGLIPDLTLDLMTLIPPSGFCCDFSDSDYCLTVENCLEMCDPGCANEMFVQIESIEIVDPGQVVGTVNPFDNPVGCAGAASLDGVDGFIELDLIINGTTLTQISVDGGTAGTTAGPFSGYNSVGMTACDGTTVDAPVSVSDDDSAVTGGADDLTDNATQTFDLAGGTFTACGGNIVITYSVMCGPPDCTAMCANCVACGVMACDPLVSTTTAPPAVVSSESTCEADGMTLSGGVIAAPATACPTGSTLEYSIDAGTTWSTTLPTYNQTTAVTVDTRCVCDSDATDISIVSSVTTVPGMCTGGGVCSITVSISNYACDDGGTPDDPSDDMVTFDYTVVDNNGTGTTWTSNQGDAGAAYGTTVAVGPILADGTTWSVMVNDDGDTACTSSANIVLSDCAPVENIPTVGEWGLIILGLLMSITAIVGIRQRREEEVYS